MDASGPAASVTCAPPLAASREQQDQEQDEHGHPYPRGRMRMRCLPGFNRMKVASASATDFAKKIQL